MMHLWIEMRITAIIRVMFHVWQSLTGHLHRGHLDRWPRFFHLVQRFLKFPSFELLALKPLPDLLPSVLFLDHAIGY